jgi:hypothetical protein
MGKCIGKKNTGNKSAKKIWGTQGEHVKTFHKNPMISRRKF